jgi:hypothetical protein
MALVAITGAKYAARALTAAGTTTVTIGAATFVSGDFGATQRMVALFTSANVFKGIAWVRRFTSTTVLELENQFVDPATGLYATQAVGDLVLVNIKSSEVTATDFVVSGIPLSVTTNDAVRFGTNGNQASVCFYEENIDFNTRGSVQVWGGVVVFGKLMSYDGTGLESLVWSRECNVKPRSDYLGGGTGSGGGNSIQYNIYATGGASAHSFFFGGMIGGTLQQTNFIGAEGTSASNGTFAFFGTRMNYGCSSPGNGGNWAVNPTRHLLYKTIHEARYNNANLIVWGNGAAQPAFLSFPQFGSGTPVGIFRASNAASFGATSNNRTVVADTGSGAFVDDINNGSYTFTNVITPTVNILRFAGGNVPITFQFSDDYTNLQPRTTLVVRRGDGTLATSVVNTASPTFTATVVQATYSATGNGAASPTNFYTTFNFGVKCYGFQVVSGTHSTVTYPLGTAGNGTDLKLGGLINQLADTGVTLTETEALALSSKITVNSGTSTITITANATYDELYDYTVAWNASSAANAVVPDHTRYLLAPNGAGLSAPTGWTLVVNTGVTLSSGAKFDFVSFTTVTLNGTGRITGIYGAGGLVSSVLELRNIKPGASYIAMNNATKATILFGTNGEATAQDYPIFFPPGSTGLEVYVARKAVGDFIDFEVITLLPGGMWYQFVDIPDEGAKETDPAVLNAYTTLETNTKLYNYIQGIYMRTEEGLKLGNFFLREGRDLKWAAPYSVVVNQSAGSVFGKASNLFTVKASGLAGDENYETNILVPPATLTAATNEVITTEVQDADGDSSLTILGGDGAFELWKVTTATATADYATGTKLADVTNEKYRYIGVTGFDIVGVDINSNVRRRSSMSKGVRSQAFFVGDQIQVVQAPQITEINNKVDVLQVDLDAIKGTGFTKDVHSLTSIQENVDLAVALSA